MSQPSSKLTLTANPGRRIGSPWFKMKAKPKSNVLNNAGRIPYVRISPFLTRIMRTADLTSEDATFTNSALADGQLLWDWRTIGSIRQVSLSLKNVNKRDGRPKNHAWILANMRILKTPRLISSNVKLSSRMRPIWRSAKRKEKSRTNATKHVQVKMPRILLCGILNAKSSTNARMRESKADNATNNAKTRTQSKPN